MKIKNISLLVIAFLGANLYGQVTLWTGTGDEAKWNDAANWRDGTYPSFDVKTVFNADNVTDCVIDVDSAKVKQLIIGDNTSYGATLIVKDGGVLTCGPEGSAAWSALGYNKSGKMIIEPGGVVNSVHRFHVGLVPPAAAEVVVLEVGGTLTAPKFTVNDPGNGNWDASCFVTLGGLIETNILWIGTGGLVDVSGGTITVTPASVTAKDTKASIDQFVASGRLTAEGGDEAARVEFIITGNGAEADTIIRITSSTTNSGVPYAPKVDIDQINYCLNETAKALYAEGTNLKWYKTIFGGIYTTTPPTPSTSIIGSTSYYVTQSNDDNGLESKPAQITVKVYEYKANAQDYEINIGEEIQLQAESNYVGSGTETYTWQTLQGALNGKSISYNPIASETIELGLSTSTGCSTSTNFAVIVEPAPNVVYDTIFITVYDTIFVAVSDTLIINANISNLSEEKLNEIKIYPNPAKDYIIIEARDVNILNGYRIIIADLLGSRVYESVFYSEVIAVDLSKWTGLGLYMVHLIDDNGNIVDTKKILLE